MSTPRPQEAEELAVSSPLGVTSVVINCLQGLIKKFCCASLPVLFDPLQFAYRPNGTPGDALVHLDTLDICVDAFMDYSSAVNTLAPPKLGQFGNCASRCQRGSPQVCQATRSSNIIVKFADGLGNTWERASLEEADKLSPWCRDKNLNSSQDLQDPCRESQHLQVPGGPNPSP